ncbi:hypothetical protein Mgra_00005211 [Meloidogyne graminicola]|uniref:7TM GPCR serpentine receptor class x (Srx) domain-containing protein n=1 Tax=Meloidogyne graminicola TaxID=189291 RepID=A0A8S9ZQ58_9BILA|nr:hypothetical protein Mgra_00005211 [Meloidogyne graminicola]
MMVYNGKTAWLYNDICYVIVSFICATFLLILLCPLYKFSKERTALYILFSKSIINCLSQLISIIETICKYLPFNDFAYFSRWFIFSPLIQMSYNAAYFHILGLAINRFHAVFFIFSYQKWWDKRNVKFYILIIWLITFIWSGIQYRIFELIIVEKKNVGILSIISTGIFMSTDLPLVTSFSISSIIYITVLTKFYYEYS